MFRLMSCECFREGANASAKACYRKDGFGRCGGVCYEMPVHQGYFLNQRVNTSAWVETKVSVLVAGRTWIRDGTSFFIYCPFYSAELTASFCLGVRLNHEPELLEPQLAASYRVGGSSRIFPSCVRRRRLFVVVASCLLAGVTFLTWITQKSFG